MRSGLRISKRISILQGGHADSSMSNLIVRTDWMSIIFGNSK